MPDTTIPATEPEQALPEVSPAVSGSQVSRLRTTLKKCFSFPVLMGTVLLVANFVIERSLRTEPDTWWHIKYGESILQTGHWPAGDIYSFTAHGIFRMAFEWGGSVLMALTYQLCGVRGMDVLIIVLTSAIVILLYCYAWLRSHNSKAALLATVVALPLATMCFTLRPRLLGFIFILLTLICLERYRQGVQKTLWVLPLIFLLWINSHGSWALGLFILGAYWASGLVGFSWGGLHAQRWRQDQRIHLALVFLMSVVVLPLNPYGTRLVAYPLNMALYQPVGVKYVQEWQPLPFAFWQSKLLLLLVLAFIVAVVALRPTYYMEELGLFLFATYATLLHARFVMLFAILMAPILASILARWVPPYEPAIDKHALNTALILIAVVGMAFYVPSSAQLNKDLLKKYPVKAIEYLKHHSVPGPMFNDYNFGGYMLWAMGPKHQVFIDGRADLYEETGVFSDYVRIVNLGPETLAILHSYGIRSCMIGPKTALSTLLSSLPSWKRVYEDKLAAIYVRTGKSTLVTARRPK